MDYIILNDPRTLSFQNVMMNKNKLFYNFQYYNQIKLAFPWLNNYLNKKIFTSIRTFPIHIINKQLYEEFQLELNKFYVRKGTKKHFIISSPEIINSVYMKFFPLYLKLFNNIEQVDNYLNSLLNNLLMRCDFIQTNKLLTYKKNFNSLIQQNSKFLLSNSLKFDRTLLHPPHNVPSINSSTEDDYDLETTSFQSSNSITSFLLSKKSKQKSMFSMLITKSKENLIMNSNPLLKLNMRLNHLNNSNNNSDKSKLFNNNEILYIDDDEIDEEILENKTDKGKIIFSVNNKTSNILKIPESSLDLEKIYEYSSTINNSTLKITKNSRKDHIRPNISTNLTEMKYKTSQLFNVHGNKYELIKQQNDNEIDENVVTYRLDSKIDDSNSTKYLNNNVKSLMPPIGLINLVKDIASLKFTKFQQSSKDKSQKRSYQELSEVSLCEKFDESALVSIAILVEELIIDSIRGWYKNGSSIGHLTRQTLKAEVRSQMNGSSITPIDDHIIILTNRLEALFNKKFSDDIKSYINELVNEIYLENNSINKILETVNFEETKDNLTSSFTNVDIKGNSKFKLSKELQDSLPDFIDGNYSQNNNLFSSKIKKSSSTQNHEKNSRTSIDENFDRIKRARISEEETYDQYLQTIPFMKNKTENSSRTVKFNYNTSDAVNDFNKQYKIMPREEIIKFIAENRTKPKNKIIEFDSKEKIKSKNQDLLLNTDDIDRNDSDEDVKTSSEFDNLYEDDKNDVITNESFEATTENEENKMFEELINKKVILLNEEINETSKKFNQTKTKDSLLCHHCNNYLTKYYYYPYFWQNRFEKNENHISLCIQCFDNGKTLLDSCEVENNFNENELDQFNEVSDQENLSNLLNEKLHVLTINSDEYQSFYSSFENNLPCWSCNSLLRPFNWKPTNLSLIRSNKKLIMCKECENYSENRLKLINTKNLSKNIIHNLNTVYQKCRLCSLNLTRKDFSYFFWMFGRNNYDLNNGENGYPICINCFKHEDQIEYDHYFSLKQSNEFSLVLKSKKDIFLSINLYRDNLPKTSSLIDKINYCKPLINFNILKLKVDNHEINLFLLPTVMPCFSCCKYFSIYSFKIEDVYDILKFGRDIYCKDCSESKHIIPIKSKKIIRNNASIDTPERKKVDNISVATTEKSLDNIRHTRTPLIHSNLDIECSVCFSSNTKFSDPMFKYYNNALKNNLPQDIVCIDCFKIPKIIKCNSCGYNKSVTAYNFIFEDQVKLILESDYDKIIICKHCKKDSSVKIQNTPATPQSISITSINNNESSSKHSKFIEELNKKIQMNLSQRSVKNSSNPDSDSSTVLNCPITVKSILKQEKVKTRKKTPKDDSKKESKKESIKNSNNEPKYDPQYDSIYSSSLFSDDNIKKINKNYKTKNQIDSHPPSSSSSSNLEISSPLNKTPVKRGRPLIIPTVALNSSQSTLVPPPEPVVPLEQEVSTPSTVLRSVATPQSTISDLSQDSSIISYDNKELKSCSICKVLLPRTSYSGTHWRKRLAGRPAPCDNCLQMHFSS